MYLQSMTLTGFRCFGPDPTYIALEPGLSAMIGANGAGKTAALEAAMRLFGVSQDQRRVRLQDFHVPAGEAKAPRSRHLSVDVVLAFPEFEEDGADAAAIPEFFMHMSANDHGTLKCRIRLDSEWTADNSVDGTVLETRRVVRTLADEFDDGDCSPLTPMDRARVQVIYVPAVRDGARHLTAFLRGRLWSAARWFDSFVEQVEGAATALNETFRAEPVVSSIQHVLATRWGELHAGGTDANPVFRPLAADISGIVGRADLVFEPSATGNDRRADELSDGQRSLLHIALTAATLDIEAEVAGGALPDEFDEAKLVLPTLTILAVEEPENSLAPFFLSRIVGQMIEIARGNRAQAVISSHSSSVLGRLEPESVRHFRLDPSTRAARVSSISLPPEADEAAKFVREAVRRYPELYFAEFVVLGEGSSEELAIPMLAEATGIPLDQSFVAVVPLGGRHVNHLWRLLNELEIPYATLLDLDRGRNGGGTGRVKVAHAELLKLGIVPHAVNESVTKWNINDLDDNNLGAWVAMLRSYGVFYCDPLDLDWALLTAFRAEYTTLGDQMEGPGESDAANAVLGEKGDSSLYLAHSDELRWYRYLFLGRSKPSTHLRVLSALPAEELAKRAPEALRALVESIRVRVA